MSLKIFYFWLYVSSSQGHLRAKHFDGAHCTVLAYVNSTIDVCRHYPQFRYFENVCPFSILLRLLCAPLRVPLPWSCIPCTELIFNNRKLRSLCPQANYTDRATAACRRS
jgi:hypothetical protein